MRPREAAGRPPAELDIKRGSLLTFASRFLPRKVGAPSLRWNLDAKETLEAIEGETNNQVDDLLVHSSSGKQFFINVKHKLTSSTSETSDFAKAIDQLVKQFLQNAESGTANGKLILVTTSNSSETIKIHFYNLLSRVRGSRSGQPLADAARNDEERRILTTVGNHITAFWTKQTESIPRKTKLKNYSNQLGWKF